MKNITAEEILRKITPPVLYNKGDCFVGHALDAMEEYASIKTKKLKSENKQLRKALERELKDNE